VTPDGEMVLGNSFNTDRGYAEAATWQWNGSTWDKQVLGALPGTFANYGNVSCNDVTADGNVVVGSNGFDWYQWTGFIWTEETGMVDVEDFLTDNGLALPPLFDIQSLTAVSDDGTVMVGFGQDMTPPFNPRNFIITNVATGVDDATAAVGAKLHMSAFPNPANAGTTLSFVLPQSERASLAIYDVGGRLVDEVDADLMPAGLNEMEWDGRDSSGAEVASGIYRCKLHAGGHYATKKLTVLR
jgi:hypothetical protein